MNSSARGTWVLKTASTQHDNLVGRGPRATKAAGKSAPNAPTSAQYSQVPSGVELVAVFLPKNRDTELRQGSAVVRFARADDLGLGGQVVQRLSFRMPEREKHIQHRDQAQKRVDAGQHPNGGSNQN